MKKHTAAYIAVIAFAAALGAAGCSRNMASGGSTEGPELRSRDVEGNMGLASFDDTSMVLWSRSDVLSYLDSEVQSSSASTAPFYRDYTMPLEAADSGIPAGESDVTDGRKLVVTAILRIRLVDLESGDAEVNGILGKYNAYSASTSAEGNGRRYSLRVPPSSYASCLADLKLMGKTLSYSERTEDVTARYYDLESRLGTQRELLKTFQSYLAKAASIDEIMTVERRIAELQGEIDRTGSQFKGLSNQIEYAVIELELVGPESAQTYDKPTLGEQVAGLFYVFTDYASGVALALLVVVLYGTPSVLIIALLYWLLLGKIGLLKKLWRLARGKRA